eukprot:scaffold24275_cov147-Cylindrotheca_fusiformis.AAC.1
MRPEVVGQHSPSSPRSTHIGLAEHDAGPGATGALVGFGIGAFVGALAGDDSQQSRMSPEVVGQHAPSRPMLAHIGLAEHDAGLVATGELVGLGTGALVGALTGEDSQQSRMRPEIVGQHSPSRPMLAHSGLAEHEAGPCATGLMVGMSTGAF